MLPQYFCGDKIYITKDVPIEQSMWVSYEILHGSFSQPDPCLMKLEIHIHSVKSVKDIDGAGWNHGKFGNGETSVVE